MTTVYQRLRRFIERGERVALATIVEVKGSVPREVGAQMIVHPLGQHVGTVGGGCGEADVIRAALDVIQTGEPTTVTVRLTEPISMESTGVCGGIFHVYVEPYPGSAGEDAGNPAPSESEAAAAMVPDTRALLDALLASVERHEPVARLVVTAAEGPFAPARGRTTVVWLDRPPLGRLGLGDLEGRVMADAQEALRAGHHTVLTYEQPGSRVRVFVEVQQPPPHLVIVGAGHIAVPLARLGKINDFRVTVIDDRPQYANRERFPDADQVIAAPIRETVRDLPTDENTCIVLVTRGHQLDVECLIEVLDRPLAYIGMIGSQRRVRAVFQLLQEEMGIPAALLDRVHAPVGLDIGAESPAEIATAIMAEIILVRRGGTGAPLSQARRRRRQTGPKIPIPAAQHMAAST